MKLFHFTLLLFLSLSATVAVAQSQYASAADSDPAALKILEQISEDYLAKEAHKISFSLDIELPGNAKEVQKGELIQSGEKFVLDMAGRKIISDTETVWMYLPDINEVQINDAEMDDFEEFSSPSDIFQLYKSKDYVFAIESYTKEAGQAITQIVGKPLSDESEYSKMRLTVIDKGQKVKNLQIFNKDGSRYTLHISEHDSDFKIEVDTFSFNAADYEGVHVEDLRF